MGDEPVRVQDVDLASESDLYSEIAPTNQEKPLLDKNMDLLPELVQILTEVFQKFAEDGKLKEGGATKWVMQCNHWQRDYSLQLAREILNRHSDAGYLTLNEFLRFYKQAARQHAYHVRKDLKQLGYTQYRPLLGKSLLTKDNRLEEHTKKCLTRIFKKFAKLDDPSDVLTLRGATEWVMKCNTWDSTRAQQLATELLRTHGNAAHLTMSRDQFLKYYRLASTQHPVHVRKDLEQLGYEVFKLAPMLTPDESSLTQDMSHVAEDIFYQFADADYLLQSHLEHYMEACMPSLDDETKTKGALWLLQNYAMQGEPGLSMDAFKNFVFDACNQDEDGLRQDLANLGYKGYAP